jgi:hypothetical protein
VSAFFLKHPHERDLALFAGGELGPLSRWRIERHLEGCSDCKQDVAEFFRLKDQISPLGELPEIDWNALAESIETRTAAEAVQPARAPDPRSPLLGWQLGLAGACALALAVWFGNSLPFEAEPTVELARADKPAAPTAAEPVGQSSVRQSPTRQSIDRLVSEAEPKAEEAFQDRRRGLSDRDEAGVNESAPKAEVASLELREAVPAETAAAPAAAEADAVFEAVGRRVVGGEQANSDAFAAFYRADSSASDALMASNGLLTVRSVSAEGILTITELYER